MTSTDVAVRGALSIDPTQSEFTAEQRAALAQIGVENAPTPYQRVFLHVCQRTGLDPFAKQIYMIERSGKYTIQTGIDGYRLVARRAADRAKETLEYEDPQWCGDDGVWKDVWLSNEHPAAARMVVIRQGMRFPFIAVWDEYVQKTNRGETVSMWKNMPSNQLRKCAEAGALRMAFPQDLSGIYIDEEVDHIPTQPDTPRTTGTDALRQSITPDQPDDEVVEAEVVEDIDDTPTTDVSSEEITDQQRVAIQDFQTEMGMTKAGLTVLIRKATGGAAKAVDDLDNAGADLVIAALRAKHEEQ